VYIVDGRTPISLDRKDVSSGYSWSAEWRGYKHEAIIMPVIEQFLTASAA
jgi:hypothetical protein